MDYSKYRFSFKEMVILLLESAGAAFVIGYLFYNSMWGLLLMPVSVTFFAKMNRDKKQKERKDRITREFIEFLKNVSTALLAGYSMENAWVEGQKELGLLYGTDCIVYQEVKTMNNAIELNIPVENVLDDFARRSGVEEIASFSEIFGYAKRTGGNFVGIIDTTTSRISRKYETYREIEVSLASKKLEQRIMNFIPLFILAYLKLSSPDYMSVLYEGIAGKVVMTTCLIVYGGALLLSGKILDISA